MTEVDLYYLNHRFIYNQKYIYSYHSSYYLICEVCNCQAYTNNEFFYALNEHGFTMGMLVLTCNEFIIKNILE